MKKTLTIGLAAATTCLAVSLAGAPAFAETPHASPGAPQVLDVTSMSNIDRAAVNVVAEPGAVITVRNGDGEIVGVRVTGSSGRATTLIPTPAPGAADETVTITQAIRGQVSEEASTSIDAPPLIDVVRATPDNALVTFRGPQGYGTSKLIIRDDEGKKVKESILTSGVPRALSFKLPAGASQKFTAERQFGDFHKTVPFTVTSGGSALEAPTLDVRADGRSPEVIVHGVPFADVALTVNGNSSRILQFDANGEVARTASEGDVVSATQSIGTDSSPAAEAIVHIG